MPPKKRKLDSTTKPTSKSETSILKFFKRTSDVSSTSCERQKITSIDADNDSDVILIDETEIKKIKKIEFEATKNILTDNNTTLSASDDSNSTLCLSVETFETSSKESSESDNKLKFKAVENKERAVINESLLVNDFALKNFSDAVEHVLQQEHFKFLLDEADFDAIGKFNKLSTEQRVIYVRLFQRKLSWINESNINYEHLSQNLQHVLKTLTQIGFLFDEKSIKGPEEILSIFKVPQLKALSKKFNVSTNGKTSLRRIDYIRILVEYFNSQNSISFSKTKTKQGDNPMKQKFMNECRALLGNSYKLNKVFRDVFVRILTLYSLSTSHHTDQKENGQQALLHNTMINMGKVKYMDYKLDFSVKIFENRQALINYQEALDLEFDLLDMLDEKDYERAYDEFNEKIEQLKKLIEDEKAILEDSKLPNYLRKFKANSIYCKMLSIFASEVLQRLKKYDEANDLFEYLLGNQNLYSLDSRHHWYERLAINYESHLKNESKVVEVICKGLEDKINVRKAGRLALLQRALKMSKVKKYEKNKDLKAKLDKVCQEQQYELKEAPIVTIEGEILQPEIIPGRKVIFMNNENGGSSSNVNICSVEQIAIEHYTQKMGYTNAKHAETSSLTTIYGLIFWDILFMNGIANVFIDKFQHAPLDINTDFFYLNRKEVIDKRIDDIKERGLDYVVDLCENTWTLYKDTQCSLVNWGLFESLEEFYGLLKCLSKEQIASLCQYFSQNYRYCRSGGPDLTLWSTQTNSVIFVEVKGPGDKLSHKQLIWLDFLISNSIKCEVCYVKSKSAKRFLD